MMERSIQVYKNMVSLFNDEEVALRFLFARGILLTKKVCDCGAFLDYKPDRMDYRCQARGCKAGEGSAFRGTFFYRAKLKIGEIIHLAHLWLCGSTVVLDQEYLGHCRETIGAYLCYFLQIVVTSLDASDVQIGGPNVIVEIDETKIGKRKNHRGHHVDGFWVLGGLRGHPQE